MKVYLTAMLVCVAFVYQANAVLNKACAADGDCDTGEKCSGKWDNCQKGVCACASGYYKVSSSATSCTARKMVGDACTSSNVATACAGIDAAVCTSDKCACPSSHTKNDEGCTFKILAKGATCSGTLGLCDPSKYLTCKSGKCDCGDANADQSTCAGYGNDADCTGGKTCRGGLVCTSNKCKCASGFTWNDKSGTSMCTNDNYTYDIKSGATCTASNNAKCVAGYTCFKCPESSSAMICSKPNGASETKVTGILSLLSVVLAMYFKM